MKGLAETLARLRAVADRPRSTVSNRLTRLEGFGSNPGNLAGYMRMPTRSSGLPLVVVLHGCTQDASSYDAGTGWSRLAELYGFAVLFPEQKRENNANLCFNWFEPGDIKRGSGEVESVIQMVDTLIAQYGLARDKVFVTGLSAGGAMTAALLATYPDRFAGGAIIAGLPFAGAAGVRQAFERMQARLIDQPGSLEALVRSASGHGGPWPTLSIWQGSADHVVSPKNVDAILDQWQGLHGVQREASRSELVNGYPRRTWTSSTGVDVIEVYSITGIGHGTPIGRPGPNEHGSRGAHIIETDISSTLAIASFWRLVDEYRASAEVPTRFSSPADVLSKSTDMAISGNVDSRKGASTAAPSGIQAAIEKALRAAGLMS